MQGMRLSERNSRACSTVERNWEGSDGTQVGCWVLFFIHSERLKFKLSGCNAGFKLRPSPSEVKEMGPAFEKRWDKFYAAFPDKPVVGGGPVAGSVPRFPRSRRHLRLPQLHQSGPTQREWQVYEPAILPGANHIMWLVHPADYLTPDVPCIDRECTHHRRAGPI